MSQLRVPTICTVIGEGGSGGALAIAVGDIVQMLQYATSGPGRRMGMLVHHDDAAREYAYDRGSKVGALDKALDAAGSAGWTVVSMKADWTTVFADAESVR